MKKIITILTILIANYCIAQNPASSGYLLTNANGSVSIGTSVNTAPLTVANFSTIFPTPQTGTLMHLVSEGNVNGRITFDTYNGSSVTGSILQGRRAAGTAALPTAAIVDYTLAGFSGDGYGSTGFHNVSLGGLFLKSEGTMTDASAPTYMAFYTTPTGSITVAERMRIKSTGVVNIAGLNSAGFVQTNSSGDLSTAALTGAQITTALGYTPYNSTNPNSYITSAALSPYLTTATAASTYQTLITTGTTAQYFRGDLSLATFPTTTASFTSSTNKNFVTDAQLTVIGNTSGTNTGDQTTVSGNAGTATILQTARLINGTSFNGSADITVTAAAGTLTGATLNSGVTASSLTSLGTISALSAGTVSQTGLTTKYNNINTVANGLSSEVATIDATAQTANIATATLYAVPASGFYRVNIYITVTSIGTTSTMPSTTITYTDGNSGTNAHSTTTTATNTGNSLTTSFAQTSYVCYAKSGTNIQYATGGYASTGSAMQYALRIRVEAL